MDFQKDVEVKGIPAYRFTPPRSVLASKEENPENAGFCVSSKECLGTGLLKVSPCRKGKHRLAQRLFLNLPSVFVMLPAGLAKNTQHLSCLLLVSPIMEIS